MLFPLPGQRKRSAKRPRLRRDRADDPAWSAAAAGPHQREAVVVLDLHQRCVERRREAWIVELDREIFAIAVAGGLLPGRTELRATCKDAIVGRLLVVLRGCNELGLDVKRHRLNGAAVAAIRCGEGADGRHDVLRLFARAAPIAASMALLVPGGDRSAACKAQSAAGDGGRPAFLTCARNAARWRQGKKAGIEPLREADRGPSVPRA